MQNLFRLLINTVKTARVNRMAVAGGDVHKSAAETKRCAEDDEITDHQAKKLKSEEPYKKKKVALMMVYSGLRYAGMQRNPGVTTIESELMTALIKAGVVKQCNADQPGEKLRFQRAARTDKAVSAAGQVCSLKMFIDVENAVEKINGHLPDDIRVLDITKVTQGFDCKSRANARTYDYLIPTFAFTPITETVSETYRMTDEVWQKVNDTLKLLLGTRNFHNFTSGKSPTDPSATRYISKFSMGKPFEKEGLEFAIISVKGQSFMIHQIRKMIGITVAVVRGLASTEVIDKCWGPVKVDVPRAPGLGLMLSKIHYDAYNRQYGNDGIHQPLNYDRLQREIDQFKEDFIYKTMIKGEKEDKSMMRWLETLHIHNFDTNDSERSKLHVAYRNLNRKEEEKEDLKEVKQSTEQSLVSEQS